MHPLTKQTSNKDVGAGRIRKIIFYKIEYQQVKKKRFSPCRARYTNNGFVVIGMECCLYQHMQLKLGVKD